ncbi:hypothetical protein FRB99_008248 [Tulasnella sp. 403]|nr:hypothetical protein FRB99_008248 [Tulasnella sp. 403]
MKTAAALSTSRPLPKHTFYILVPPRLGAKPGLKSTTGKAASKHIRCVPRLGAKGGPKRITIKATPKRKAVVEPEEPDKDLGKGKRQRKLSQKAADPNNIMTTSRN